MNVLRASGRAQAAEPRAEPLPGPYLGVDVPQEALPAHAAQAGHRHRLLPRPRHAARRLLHPGPAGAQRGGGTAGAASVSRRAHGAAALRDGRGTAGAMMALRGAAGPGRWLGRALAAPGTARAPPLAAAAPAPAWSWVRRPAGPRPLGPAARFASTQGREPEAEGPRRRVVVVRISSPLAWLRSRCYYLLIRLYFDPEFSVEEFTRGAKQVRGRAGCRLPPRLVWGAPGGGRGLKNISLDPKVVCATIP